MKKFWITALAVVLTLGNAMGKPANPKWLKQLAAEGNQAKLEEVMKKSERRAEFKGKAVTHSSVGEAATSPNLGEEFSVQAGARRVATPLNIAPNGLVILVNFSDLSWTKATHAEMNNMLTGQNYTRNYSYTYEGETVQVSSSGSARQYFYDSSNGQYNPQFTVIGPVTLSHNYAYYGQNESGGDDAKPEDMVVEACRLADAQGVDFTQFDNNNDGQIDFVYIFYAGYQESDGAGDNYIWPHSYALEYYYYLSTREGGRGQSQVMLDGKLLNKYACSGEIEIYSNQHDGIGTFCHEFSHVLGLPDLYSTSESTTHKTMGEWDILDYGPYNNEGNTPPLYSAYEKFFMGWLTPTVISEAGTYTLNAGNEAYLLCAGGQHNLVGNDPNPTTFYLLENRQQTGWDEYLPGHGMMLTKVQYSFAKWDENTVNNSPNAMGVDILEADGRAPAYNENNPYNGYFGKEGDLFPAGATSCSKITGYPLSNIAEANGVITFTLGNSGGGGGGTTTGDCSNYSWTATSALSAGEVLLEDYNWTITAPAGAYFGYEGSQHVRGAQFGSKKNPVGQISLSTYEVAECLISSVTINASQAKDGDSQLSVYIGGTRIGDETSLTASAADYTFTNSAGKTGSLEIRITNTQKAAYLKSISITQTSTALPSDAVTTEQTDRAQKVWKDGRLLIIRDGETYDALGRKAVR